ncbi:MAG: hypothetical protein WA139_03825 [Candidatus Aenigmatarchaeota archaeon]
MRQPREYKNLEPLKLKKPSYRPDRTKIPEIEMTDYEMGIKIRLEAEKLSEKNY